MNLRWTFFPNWVFTFDFAIALMVASTLGLAWWFKRSGWI